jgi:hypothetical protein
MSTRANKASAPSRQQENKAEDEVIAPWWDPKFVGFEKFSPATRMLVNDAIETGRTVLTGFFRGVLEDESNPRARDRFITKLISLTNGSMPFTSTPMFGRGASEALIVWPEGSITIKVGADRKFDVEVSTTNEKAYDDLAEVVSVHILPEHVRQPIYSLADGPNGVMEIVEVGIAGAPFERDNYSDDVLEGYDFIVEDLQRSNPVGRLVLLQGAPGTGKTFLVRGLLNDVYDAVFVLVPPSKVEQLAGPELVPVLVRARSLLGIDKPIVIIIEDADLALVSRDEKDGNLSAISALLNASDGMIGWALNLRIICTTNKLVKQIDDALRRPGRLSREIVVDYTPLDRAKEIFARITEGEEAVFEAAEGQSGVALGLIYEVAKNGEIDEARSEDSDEETDEDADEETDEDAEPSDEEDEDNEDEEDDEDNEDDED